MSTIWVDLSQIFFYAPVMSPEQVRAARGWLAWSQSELAAQANVGLSTVKDYEGGRRTPIANNLEAIQKALENAGIKFASDSISGPIAKRPVES
jgi:DNA-binding transcriptional regulator YiaG